MSLSARNHIAEVGHSFIQDGHTVLIHGLSRVATALILKAAEMNTYFNLVITEGRPNLVNQADLTVFEEAGIPTRIIPDSGVGVMMEEIDFILVGAEGVMENGGIINKVRESLTKVIVSIRFIILICFFLIFFLFLSISLALIRLLWSLMPSTSPSMWQWNPINSLECILSLRKTLCNKRRIHFLLFHLVLRPADNPLNRRYCPPPLRLLKDLF
jgi:hypothetical protein